MPALCTVSPRTGLRTFLLSPKNSDEVMFHTENAGRPEVPEMPEVCLFCPADVCRVVGGLQAGHGKPHALMGAARARCAETPHGSAPGLWG